MYYGKGAGAEPTASAVIADLVDVTRLHTVDSGNRVPHLAFQPDQVHEVAALPIEECHTSSYLRLEVLDRPGVLAELTHVLAAEEISIAAMIQKAPEGGRAEIVMTTHRASEAAMNRAIAAIEALEAVQGAVTRLRIEPLAD
jgi:homoserine dehydrogenase